jgi:trigger factor
MREAMLGRPGLRSKTQLLPYCRKLFFQALQYSSGEVLQVKEISSKGLRRAFTVTVPQHEIEKNMLTKLQEVGKKAKIPGFRPGKVPMDVLRKRYGPSTRAEVLDQTVSDATEKALMEHNLRPAVQPKIELVTFAEGGDLEFKLDVEILPDITPGDFSTITLERPIADVDEKTIVAAIERAAKNVRKPETVTDTRAAKLGDVLIIDFDGTVDGTKREGMNGQDHSLELGSNSFVDTFEMQLIGSKVGDSTLIAVTFPSDYHAADLAGKKAEFRVDVKELRQSKPVLLNDELAKELGFPSIDKLRERVREDIAADYGRITRAIVKRKLMDWLAAMHDFEIPTTLFDAEFKAIWQQVEDSKAKGDLPEEDKKKSDSQLMTEYQDIATRRIRLGLLLAEIARKENIGVAPNDMRNALMAEARRFPGQEKAVVDYYTQTQGAMERIRAPLLEEKVVDHILANTILTDKKVTAEDLLKMPEEMN